MALDPLAQGFEQSGEAADPARHDRTVDLNAAAGVDVGLTMQRQMIAELRHDDMGEQRRTRTPLLDRQRRHRRLDDGLARPAAHLRRTCTTRLKWEGTYSSTSRSSAPIRPNLSPPQAGHAHGASWTIVSAGK